MRKLRVSKHTRGAVAGSRADRGRRGERRHRRRQPVPWRLARGSQAFSRADHGHAVIMGRKTWESLPRALPERQNIVVTRQRDFVAAGAEVARLVRRRARPCPSAGARVLHRRRRTLSRRPALRDDAAPHRDRARLRRRRPVSAGRARRLARNARAKIIRRANRTDFAYALCHLRTRSGRLRRILSL